MNKSGDPGTAYQQLTLFAVEAVAAAAPTRITPNHDSHWDAITDDKCDRAAVPEHGTVQATHSAFSAPDLPLAQEHFAVPEQQTDNIVLEQDTREVLPIVEYLEKIGGDRLPHVLERDTIPEQKSTEHLQWVEQYRPSTRKGHSYYRYCYKQSRKIHHIHIPGGNTRSSLAQSRKSEVDSAIAEGKSPHVIEKLICSWRYDK